MAFGMKEKFKNSALARMFASGPENREDHPVETGPETAEEPSSLAASPSRHALVLPEGHALYRLWENYCRQSGQSLQPDLHLEGPEEEPLPDDAAQKELRRLQMKINVTANRRLDAIYSQRKTGKGDERSERAEDGPPHLDAEAMVAVSGDGLTAWLLVFPPVGPGGELDRAMLTEALEQNQVCFGLDETLLDRLPQEEGRYFKLFTAARGTPPVHGRDGRVVDFFPRTSERRLTADERVDSASVNAIHNVKKGEEICHIILPAKGVPGQTVEGREICARDGRAAVVPKGKNTQISADGKRLEAALAGHVEFQTPNFHVRPLMEIPGNVDSSVGNINFLGDVRIYGDICSGFMVRAMGSITVDGVVEACTVEAGGDLVVSGGVQGDNQAVIRAQRNIFAKFIENSCVYVKDSLHADCLINCDVYCDGEVEVRSGRMTVIGGTLRAARSVSAGTVGSRAECRTEVFLGGQPCADFECHILHQEIGQLEKDLEKTERQPDSPAKLSSMSKMRMQLMINRKKLAQLDKERELAAGEQEEAEKPPLRLACSTVYPGTVLGINGVTHQFDRRYSPCTADLAGGEIRLQ